MPAHPREQARRRGRRLEQWAAEIVQWGMRRRNELDALRGIFLLVMAGTHLPTALNVVANQPLGFVSAAEGFVFLSAFLVGSIYTPLLAERGLGHVRERLWKRARKLYGYHLLLLLFVFTVVAGVAEWSGSRALHDYLLVFFHHPLAAVAASPFFIYQPPLLDILPMYIVFLALSPALLRLADRRGWRAILCGSGLLWLFAELGGARQLYQGAAALGLPLPRDACGAFNWFAWQLVWVSGLWLGFGQHRPDGLLARAIRYRGRPLTAGALALSVMFLLWRHHVGGLLTGLGSGWAPLDKWTLGPLRIVNCVALGIVLDRALLPALRWMRVRVLELLGRNSLQVFAAHIPICVLGDGLLGHDAAPPDPLVQVVLILTMLAVMLLVARRTEGNNARGEDTGRRGRESPILGGRLWPVPVRRRDERAHR